MGKKKRSSSLFSLFSEGVLRWQSQRPCHIFCYSFLTTGCNYLMRVPAYPGLTPSCAFLPLEVCYDISACISTCSLSLHSQFRVVWLTNDWQMTDGHSAFFFRLWGQSSRPPFVRVTPEEIQFLQVFWSISQLSQSFVALVPTSWKHIYI